MPTDRLHEAQEEQEQQQDEVLVEHELLAVDLEMCGKRNLDLQEELLETLHQSMIPHLERLDGHHLVQEEDLHEEGLLEVRLGEASA